MVDKITIDDSKPHRGDRKVIQLKQKSKKLIFDRSPWCFLVDNLTHQNAGIWKVVSKIGFWAIH
jgi:hypothetical protein